MKIMVVIFSMLTMAVIFVCEGCGGSGSGGVSTCVANASCCNGTGYSSDGGTTCYHNSNCSNGCGGSSVTELKIKNTGSSAVTIGFVTAAYGGACLEGGLLTAEELFNAALHRRALHRVLAGLERHPKALARGAVIFA